MLPNDGNSEPAGEQKPPTSEPSQGTSQLSQADIEAVLQRLDATEKQVRGLQKGTDKQIGQVRDEVKRILELKEKGLDESQIHRELMIDQMLQGQTAAPAPVEGKPQASGQGFDVSTVVKAMQFAENDVAVAAMMKAYAGDLAQLVSQLAQLKINQASVKTSPANALPPQGGQSGGASDLDAMISELNVWQKNPTKFREQIKARVKELDARGWK